MAIEKRVGPNGRTAYRVRIADYHPVTGKRRNITVGTWATKAEAKRHERQAMLAQERGSLIEPSKLTVDDVVTVWLAAKKGAIAPNTHYQYDVAYRLHLKPELGLIPVQKLTHEMVQHRIATLTGEGKSPSLVRRCLLVLRQALSMAMRRNLVLANVADHIEQPPKGGKKALIPWTDAEIAAFLRAAEKDILWPLWPLLAMEGMRRGEALGLRWRDVDLEAGTAIIFDTVIADSTKAGAALVQERTKTSAGTRGVTLTQHTVAALRLHRDRCRFAVQAEGGSWSDERRVISPHGEQPVNPGNVKYHRLRLIAQAKVKPITTHDMRHIAATKMLLSGVPISIVSRKLGHASEAITLAIYSHVIPSDQSRAADAMDAIMTRAAMNGQSRVDDLGAGSVPVVTNEAVSS